MPRVALALALGAGTLVPALPALGQPTEGGRRSADQAAAEALFREGRARYEAGDLKAACAKFAASFALDEALGTLLNLARCHKEEGKTASAWGAYTELAGLAERAGQRDRRAIAVDEAAALEPVLMRLQVTVADPT
ncbi:MAG: hypothetical protein AAF928_21220, partial [Myxococcota bacterium]